MPNIELLEDACAKLPHSTRAMFGGHGLFANNGGMFAGIVDDDQIVLKMEQGTPEHDAFRKVGGVPWVYKGKMGASTMKAWLLVPDTMYDEPRTLAEWAAKAYRIVPAKKAARPRPAAKATAPRKTSQRGSTRNASTKRASGKKSAKKR